MTAHEPAPLDGNALAGPLQFLASADPTTMVLRCASCGRTDMTASVRAFVTAMGSVGRCAGCDEVLVVVVEHPRGVRVAMPGAAWIGTVQ